MKIIGWRIEAIKVLYQFCLANELDLKQSDVAKEFGLSSASISNIEKKFQLKRNFNRKKLIRYIINENNCWLWQLYCNDRGYAMESNTINGKDYARLVHKYNYERKYSKVPEGMQLDHLCRVRSCVNPDHLEVVTPAENTRRSNCTKLTKEQVLELRRLHSIGYNSIALQSKFSISQAQVSAIINKKRWRDI